MAAIAAAAGERPLQPEQLAGQASCATSATSSVPCQPAEAAEIAGMVQAPSSYDPRYHRERTSARRAYVPHRMASLGYLAPEEAWAAAAEPVLRTGRAHC